MHLRAAAERHGDVLLAVLLAPAITAELVAWQGGVHPAALGMGLLGTLPIALRRRAPLVSFAMVMTGLELLSIRHPGFDNQSTVFVLAFFCALYSVGRHARGLEAWLGAVGVVLAMALFVVSEAGLASSLGDIAFVVAFAGAPWGIGLALRLRQEREVSLRAESARLAVEQEQRAEQALVDERARIARELHDVVAHAISVTVLQARGARRQLDTDTDAVRQALDAIEETNTAALSDMRRLLALLRDTDTEAELHTPQPSLDQLDRLLDQVRASGVPVSLEVRGERAAVPPGVDLSAYRIVQEALTNVVKHAGRVATTVRLVYSPAQLEVSVRDEGSGSAGPRTAAGGQGLIGIRERAAVLGGEVVAGPRQDGGYEVSARLPYAVEAP